MYAIEHAGLLPALKRENNNYMLYVESDANLRIDSSLNYDPATGTISQLILSVENLSTESSS